MAFEQPGFKIGALVAGADLRSAQYCFVKLNASGQVVLATVAGEKVLGVLQNAPNVGEPAEVVTVGITKVKANAAITAGALIMSAVTTGRALTAATTGSTITGWALETCSNAGEVISAYVNCGVGVV